VTKQVANNTLLPENIRLEDGSRVVLYPKSALSYQQPFDSLQRNIAMQGRALFKVVADRKRPFSVTADSTTTTVLGTEFEISTQPDHEKIRVSLLEGRVVVRARGKNGLIREVYLKPGEECTVDQQLNKMDVRLFGEKLKKALSPDNENEGMKTLSFSKEPLPNVFKTIEKIYHVEIRWKGKAIHKLLFTGKFYPTDSLEMVIAAICNTNDLAFEEKDDIITITPIK
jgi:ferric-dicitrate binding protein FerR (iron transport regulator)